MQGYLCLSLLLLPALVLSGQNLLHNPGFESGTGSWTCNDCTGSQSSDKRSGSHSFKVTNRHHDWSGASQEVYTNGGHYYYFKAWVKILNTASGKDHTEMIAMVDILDNNGKHQYDRLGDTKFVYKDRWYLIGGDKYIQPNIKSVRFYVQAIDQSVNYLLDDTHMDIVDYISPTSFHNDANHRIDQLRKTSVSLSLHGITHPTGISVQLQQTSSEFGWGSAVNARTIVDNNHKAYQNFFYNTFEWAVLENAMKWPQIEPSQGHYDFNTPLNAVNAMESRGIKMRGHNIFWGLPLVPNWQKSMSGSQLRPELSKHMNDMMKHFKGKFKHWDVNNENTHLHFYEDKLHDEYITHWMIREGHKQDPHALMFLNDYDAVGGGTDTMSYLDQIYWFKASGVPIQGIGVQCHYGAYVDISITKRRLDELAAAGIPIWVTELDISEPDENKKAQKYEDLMRMFFSHPAVHGVLFWGFWDQRHWRPTAAIATGNNVTPNAAGRKVQQLLQHTWRTNESHDMSHGNAYTKVFKGSYKITVHHNGQTIHTENVYINGGHKDIKINLSGSGSRPHVNQVLIG